jgi:hypothetical protein
MSASSEERFARLATTNGTTMSGRSIAVIGLLVLALAAPAGAQTRAPADSEAWANEQAKPTEQAPPAARQSTPAQPRIVPPARADDEFAPPPQTGCQYRGNKLDLLV